MVHFAMHLHQRGLAPRSIQGQMSALPFYAKVRGCKDYAIDFCVQKMIEGCGCERHNVRDYRSPFTPDILVKLVNTWRLVCKDHFEACLFKASTLIALIGALHISKLVASAKNDTLLSSLQRKDVMIS